MDLNFKYKSDFIQNVENDDNFENETSGVGHVSFILGQP